MTTLRSIAQRSLRLIGAASVGQPYAAEDMKVALEGLTDVLSRLSNFGAGRTEVDYSGLTANDASPLPVTCDRDLAFVLADVIHQEFTPDINPHLASQIMEAKERINARLNKPTEIYPDVPRSARGSAFTRLYS